MADRSPWIDWSWFKAGPFLGSEQARSEYDAQQKSKKPQQRPTLEEYRAAQQQAAMDAQAAQQRAMSQTGPQWAADNSQSGIPQQDGWVGANGNQTNGTPFPSDIKDWSWWDKARGLFSDEGAAAYQKARGLGVDENTQSQTVAPDMPSNVPVPTPRPDMGTDENTPMQTVIPDNQTNAAPLDPIEQIKQQKAMIDAIYPQRPPQDLGQSAIDAETDKDRQRANYMAQLAFFSGITSGAGGQWEGVGRGLAGAGQAYSEGFNRYQKALDNRAKRMQSNADNRYADETNRSDAAVKLYTAQEANKKGQLSETRQALKDRISDIDEYFKQRLTLAKGNEYTPTDQGAADRILKDWRISRDRGEIVSSTDVSDK